jgi:ZIP family zinc transporter
MRKERWPLLRVLGLWAVVVVVSAACAGLGAVVLDDDQGTVAGIARTFAAGALLAMVSDTMVPDAYEKVREWAGGLVVLGFALSLLLAGLLS